VLDLIGFTPTTALRAATAWAVPGAWIEVAA